VHHLVLSHKKLLALFCHVDGGYLGLARHPPLGVWLVIYLIVVPLELLVGEVSYEFLNLPVEAILHVDIALGLLEPSGLVHCVQLAPIFAIEAI